MRARAYPGAAHAPAVLAGLLAVLLGALWAALLAPGAVPVAAEGLRSVTAGARLLGPEQGAAAPQFGDLFDGVSCAGTLGCMAVGASQDPAGVSVPLADQRVGSTWGPALRGGIAGDHDFGFHAVSCPAVDYCEGVSYHGPTMTASHQLPLAAGWDGRSWRLQEVPVPAGSTGASLLAVSCLSAGFCEAVGYSAAAKGDTTLAENLGRDRLGGRSPPRPLPRACTFTCQVSRAPPAGTARPSGSAPGRPRGACCRCSRNGTAAPGRSSPARLSPKPMATPA